VADSKEIQELKRALQLKEYELENFLQYARQIIKILDEERVFRAFLSAVMGQIGSPRALLRIKTLDRVFVLWKGFELGEEVKERIEREGKGIRQVLESLGLSVVIDLSFASEETALFLRQRGIEHFLSLKENFLALTAGDLSQEALNYIRALYQITLLAYENILFHREVLKRQRLERELEIARAIQTGLLPGEVKIDGYDAFARSIPSHQVGGDYYDVIERGRTTLAVIGDVAGKGIPAALIMANLQASLKTLVKFFSGELGDLMGLLNKGLMEGASPEGPVFVTFFAVELGKEGDLLYTNAGHNPPILVRRDGEVLELTRGGLVLGVADVPYGAERERMFPGDLLFMYTDGLSEATFLDGSELGRDRLKKMVQDMRELSPREIGDKLLSTLSKFYEVSDDLTIFILKKV